MVGQRVTSGGGTMDTDLELEMAQLRQDTDLDAVEEELVDNLATCPDFKAAIVEFVEDEAAKISSAVLTEKEIQRCVWNAAKEVLDYGHK